MATIVLQQHSALREHSSTPPPLTSTLTLNTPRSSTPIPNKHIPFCPPGPAPSTQVVTPPHSPPTNNAPFKPSSLLHPPHNHRKLLKSPPIYGLDCDSLAQALNHAAGQPLPPPSSVFPWLHGLHPNNQTQLQFFLARKKSLRKIPKCLREVTIIKAGGDLSRARIKGAVAPDEVLSLCDDDKKGFLDCDPQEGFSVRNFHIQAAKIIQVSDTIIYGDDRTDHRIIRSVAERAAKVQRQWRKELEAQGQMPETYHTFVLTSPFEDFERAYPELVAVNSRGKPTGQVLDFLHQERVEMCAMSKASEISVGVYQGPSPNPSTIPPTDSDEPTFDVFIECSDHANMPDTKVLSCKSKQLRSRRNNDPVHLSFPSSGSLMPSSYAPAEADGIIAMCQWIYNLTHVPQTSAVPCTPDKDGDIPMTELTPRTRKVLFHCPDGYTETSMLTVAYHMFAEGVPLHDAWIQLHVDNKRNFFAYASDVALLRSIEEQVLQMSPAATAGKRTPPPTWLGKLDGSLPSRILPYMYLGNLTHANNSEMLKRLGIKRILSVGEPVSWTKNDWESWGRENVMFVDRVQDNGIDELGPEIERCLDFIGRGKADGTATLVHCRVGVSRSATICIAEVMKSEGMSFPRAYCFVRARRLNVIIQPHLRFVYELMKWDELQQERRGETVRRELEWTTVAREIAQLNRPYSRA